MSAQVTEKHIDLVRCVLDAEWWGSNVEKSFAQIIADSEAKACADLRAEVERLTAGWDKYANMQIEMDALCARAERAEAELATERARLDWLMAGGVCMVQHSGGFYVSRLHAQVSRAAIDSGMKEETK